MDVKKIILLAIGANVPKITHNYSKQFISKKIKQ